MVCITPDLIQSGEKTWGELTLKIWKRQVETAVQAAQIGE
jgi:hypothetical protein